MIPTHSPLTYYRTFQNAHGRRCPDARANEMVEVCLNSVLHELSHGTSLAYARSGWRTDYCGAPSLITVTLVNLFESGRVAAGTTGLENARGLHAVRQLRVWIGDKRVFEQRGLRARFLHAMPWTRGRGCPDPGGIYPLPASGFEI